MTSVRMTEQPCMQYGLVRVSPARTGTKNKAVVAAGPNSVRPGTWMDTQSVEARPPDPAKAGRPAILTPRGEEVKHRYCED